MNIQYVFDEHSRHYRASLSLDIHPLLDEFINKPVNYLEIGVYEGGSACLIFDHILTHPESRYVGIDDKLRERAIDNLSQFKGRTTLICGDSANELPSLLEMGTRFDIIYIDGCHHIDYAMHDLVHSMNLCKPNGIILIDDYEHHEYGLKKPIDEYVSLYANDFKIVHQRYRLGLRRIT